VQLRAQCRARHAGIADNTAQCLDYNRQGVRLCAVRAAPGHDNRRITMKRWLRSGILATALLAGCTGLRVDLDYDPARNFSAYQSYAWLPAATVDGEAVVRNDLVEARIVNAVDNALGAKKMRRADKDSADFLVTYHINIENRVEVRTIDTGFGYYRPWWHWNSRFDTETIVQNYKAGTLILDIIDRQSNRLAWRASSETRLREGLTPQQRDEEIRNIVNAMLSRFPPGANAQ
jgi:hypothetical protein